MRYLAFIVVGLLAFATRAPGQGEPAAEPAADALLLAVEGPIGPAVSDLVVRTLKRAAAEGREAVILRIDTPGGLDTSMRVMIKEILASPVPVVSWVAPGGARAASAGTYILYASHVAAMAPATNLGAATPVAISPGGVLPGADKPGPGRGEDGGEDDKGGARDLGPKTPMERKIVNDAVAYIRGLATLRGRNVEWAEEAVREGASLPAEDALARDVIDLMASDLDGLLAALDGRTVVAADREITLDTGDWRVATIVPDWRTRLLAVLTNPNVAYLLMLIGVYGLLFEFYSPGAVLPGIAGAISLVLALYAFHVLPVNYAGIALILVGIGLMALELFSPGFGVVGGGGVVAFVFGSVILIDTDVEGMQVSIPLVATMAIAASGLFVATILGVARMRNRSVVTGIEQMIGAPAEAVEAFTGAGVVRAHGEIWSARCDAPVDAGEILRITRIDGLVLEVEPAREENPQ